MSGAASLRPPAADLEPGPQERSRAFAGALSEGDLAAATDCFARDACLLTPDATAIRGRAEIRAILGQMVARRTRIEVLASAVPWELEAGDRGSLGLVGRALKRRLFTGLF